jgi:hypothetical protein
MNEDIFQLRIIKAQTTSLHLLGSTSITFSQRMSQLMPAAKWKNRRRIRYFESLILEMELKERKILQLCGMERLRHHCFEICYSSSRSN